VCGRFTLRSSPESITEHFDLDEPPELEPRYNIAPGQTVLALRAEAARGTRVAERLRWGLVPPWADSAAVGQRMINARAETLSEKPAFRAAFRDRRCLIPADGFYEWRKASGSPKQPYLFERPDGAPFAFAGLFESWREGEKDAVWSCTIVTTEANEVLAGVHARMPVILDARDYRLWLDPENHDLGELQRLLTPCPEAWLTRKTVGSGVNDARRDAPDCAAEAPPQPRQGELW
jgi:putative SOS response-associated peptidase YedK